jgi:hypothetical protein
MESITRNASSHRLLAARKVLSHTQSAKWPSIWMGRPEWQFMVAVFVIVFVVVVVVVHGKLEVCCSSKRIQFQRLTTLIVHRLSQWRRFAALG